MFSKVKPKVSGMKKYPTTRTQNIDPENIKSITSIPSDDASIGNENTIKHHVMLFVNNIKPVPKPLRWDGNSSPKRMKETIKMPLSCPVIVKAIAKYVIQGSMWCRSSCLPF